MTTLNKVDRRDLNVDNIVNTVNKGGNLVGIHSELVASYINGLSDDEFRSMVIRGAEAEIANKFAQHAEESLGTVLVGLVRNSGKLVWTRFPLRRKMVGNGKTEVMPDIPIPIMYAADYIYWVEKNVCLKYKGIQGATPILSRCGYTHLHQVPEAEKIKRTSSTGEIRTIAIFNKELGFYCGIKEGQVPPAKEGSNAESILTSVNGSATVIVTNNKGKVAWVRVKLRLDRYRTRAGTLIPCIPVRLVVMARSLYWLEKGEWLKKDRVTPEIILPEFLEANGYKQLTDIPQAVAIHYPKLEADLATLRRFEHAPSGFCWG